MTILKTVRKLQITKVMTDVEGKYEVEFKSAIFQRLDANFAKTIIIRIKSNVAPNESITSQIS